MSKVTYTDSGSTREHDEWMAGSRIDPSCSISSLAPDHEVIRRTLSFYDIETAELKVTEYATHTFDASTPDDYFKAKQRNEIENKGRLSALNDLSMATAKKDSSQKRETKYEPKRSFGWNKHTLFYYGGLLLLIIIAYSAQVTMVGSTIISSGLFDVFIEKPFLALLIATVPILGATILKNGDSLLVTEKSKLIYARTLHVITFILTMFWVFYYSEVFESGGGDVLSLIDSSSGSSSTMAYRIWLGLHLLTELFAGGSIALVAQKIYLSGLKKIETENPTYVGALEDEFEAISRVRGFDNRIASNESYIYQIDSAKEKYILESLSVLHDYHRQVDLAKRVGADKALLNIANASESNVVTMPSSKMAK